MTFPQAEKGIKKIYIAQILSVISAVIESLTASFFIVCLIMIYNNMEISSVTGYVISTVLFSLISPLLMAIGYVLTLTGLFKAKADDENFKVSLYASVLSIVIQVVGVIWSYNNAVTSITNYLTTVTSFLSSAYIILGIRALAVKLDRTDIDIKGKRCYNVITVLFVLMTISDVAVLIVNGTQWADLVVLSQLFGGILSFVQFIMIMLYLKKARKMLLTR